MRNQRGITLIALVITIIVLLILAGVSIAMLTGDNGILNRATDSVAATNIAEDREAITLDLSAAYTDYMDAKYVSAGEGIDTTDFVTFLYTSGLTASGNTSDYLKDTAHYQVVVSGTAANNATITITTVSTGEDNAKDSGTVNKTGGISWAE